MFNSRFIVIGVIAILLESCKTTPPAVTNSTPVPAEEPVLVQLGDKQYTTRDFAASYEKNKYTTGSDKPLTAEEYLDLFTNMKLKVLAAQQEGNDTTQNFKDEISSYREILSQNFLNDKDLIEKYAMEAYERSKMQVHAAHILVRVPEFAAPADTLKAFETAQKAWSELVNGADFEETVAKYSQDPSAKENHGDLGSFTVFQMVYPFENAAYKTPVGKFSPPVRSVHGYHIIKVLERNDNPGKIQVAHCMISSNQLDSREKQTAAQEKINEAYNRLKAGEAWADVVKSYSDDKKSAQNGGTLPPFGIGTMIRPFEHAAFALSTPGDITQPVKTAYGWHIIRLIKKLPIESYEEAAPAIRQKVTQDSRGKLVEKINQQKVRTKYPVTENLDVLNRVETLTDSTLLRGRWTIPAPVPDEIRQAHLFAVSGKTYTGGDFLEYLRVKQKPLPANSSVPLVVKRYYQDFVNEKAMAHAKEQLEKDQPEFRQLMEEISDGVMLSNMMEKNVWGKSLTDSLGQRRVFEQNKGKYQYPERIRATLAVAKDTAVLNRAKRLLSGYPYSLELKGEDLIFGDKESNLTPELTRRLGKVVTAMSANPQYIVEVSSHRDRGEPKEASELRLSQVVSFLEAHEIPLTRVVEKNHDALRNTSDAAGNRRVSFLYFTTSAADVARMLNRGSEQEEVTIKDGYMTKDDPLLNGFDWKTGEQEHATSGGRKWIMIKTIEKPRLKSFEEARGAVINDYQQILERQWLEKLKGQYPATVNKNELNKVK
ncbi:hypothetical protein GCM10023091_10770 [Ravibacter arvi]|uniref:PpiC domain-containing protein n=1 Tax=Ravibacter arvi TaxID=2051041 RepID=A0ABP8LRL6_9BACT